MIYVFDGTFYGFLNCIFECFEMKEWHAVPITETIYQPSFFDNSRWILTDEAKAERILKGLRQKIGSVKIREFYSVFLSEDPQAWKALFAIGVALFKQDGGILENYGNTEVLYVSQILKKVHRESHRMKAFVRFHKSADGVFVAMITPDFNVLPLIVSFFKKRYLDQSWLIYDVKRNYGIHCDGYSIKEVQLNKEEQDEIDVPDTSITEDALEKHFQQLWKQYFKSTNIEARRNMKMHLQHLPVRYWKYLVEKN